MSPGLHIFCTPERGDPHIALCLHLKRFLPAHIKCDGGVESFTRPPILSERFSTASQYQYFYGPNALQPISSHIAKTLCTALDPSSPLRELCSILAGASTAAYIDYDFQAISRSVTLTIFSPPIDDRKSTQARWTVRKRGPKETVEVGVLSAETPDEPEELKMGGYLTVLEADDKPSPVLFSFPSRHHPLGPNDQTTYAVSFRQPTGLHPVLEITLPARHLRPPKDSCALHAYWTLPSEMFLDRYQLTDELFLASQNLVALRALSGEQDLEAPGWAVKKWGSAALLELAHPAMANNTAPVNWTITIPTHLRYITGGSSGNVPIPWPIVFWACEAQEGLKMSTNPFDRVNVGYDGLFGPKTMFYHIPPAATAPTLFHTVTVPTLREQQTQWVPAGTMLTVLIGFAWVLWKLLFADGPRTPGESDVKKSQ